MIRSFRIVATAAILAMAMIWSGTARSGEGEYDASSENHGPVFFGIAADARGKVMADVRVTLTAKDQEPVVLKTTVLGLYRGHFKAEVRPEDVQVTCQKDGYRTTRVIRRGIQTNCTLEAH